MLRLVSRLSHHHLSAAVFTIHFVGIEDENNSSVRSDGASSSSSRSLTPPRMYFTELFQEELENDAMLTQPSEVLFEEQGSSCLICRVVLKEIPEEYQLGNKDDLYVHMLDGAYLDEVLKRQKKFEDEYKKAQQQKKSKQREKANTDKESLMRPSSRPMPQKRNTTKRTIRLAERKLAKESLAKKKSKTNE